MSFAVFQCFAFRANGQPVTVPASEIRVTCDSLQQRFILVLRDSACILAFSDIKYVLMIDAEEKTALMRSVGRAALIGTVAGLWRSPGRGRGGAGLSAVLADLALNGAQKKSLFSGFICFNNGVILLFDSLVERDLEALSSMMHEGVFSEEGQLYFEQLLARQQEYLIDGEKVVDELFADVCTTSSAAALALRAIEQSPKLHQRSNQRRRAAQIADELRSKCVDLAFACHANRLNLNTIAGRSEASTAEIRGLAHAALLQNAVKFSSVTASAGGQGVHAISCSNQSKELVNIAHNKFKWPFIILSGLIGGVAGVAVEEGTGSSWAQAIGFLVSLLMWWVLRSITAWAVRSGDEPS